MQAGTDGDSGSTGSLDVLPTEYDRRTTCKLETEKKAATKQRSGLSYT